MPAYIRKRHILQAPNMLELNLDNLRKIKDKAMVWQLWLWDYEDNNVMISIEKNQDMYRIIRHFYHHGYIDATHKLLKFSERPLDVVIFKLDGVEFNTNCPANFKSPEHLNDCLFNDGLELLHHAYSNGFPEPNVDSVLKNPFKNEKKPFSSGFINEIHIFENNT